MRSSATSAKSLFCYFFIWPVVCVKWAVLKKTIKVHSTLFKKKSERQIKTSERGRKKNRVSAEWLNFPCYRMFVCIGSGPAVFAYCFFFLPVCMSPFLPSHFLAEGNQSAVAGAPSPPSPPSQRTLSVTRFSSSVICSFHSTARAVEDETSSPLTADHTESLCAAA